MRTLVLVALMVFVPMSASAYCNQFIENCYTPPTTNELLDRSRAAQEYNQRIREHNTQQQILREQRRANAYRRQEYNQGILDSLGW